MTSKSVEVRSRGVGEVTHVWVDVGAEAKMSDSREPAVANEKFLRQIN